ncbi:Ankyrin repeat and SOCS box protein 13 [Fasciola gigantica]|uniref:Ankyrin repeat and SOCS box protein 13 n=1 Tax=Fasciola gigantica TaxID=46835 RepID=A0A504YXS7_FASGI|nr:Ankyrin repeat and SOCS box protein 13 [Fasciola gigantica]
MCALPSSPGVVTFIRVIESGDLGELLSLVKQTDAVCARDADNNTLLHHACIAGNVDAVKLLIASGLHANVGNVDGHTPLCDAALNGSTEIVSILLQCGVNVNPPSYWGSPLMYATQNERLGAMKLLIDAGAQLNSPDRTGLCPLHVAVQKRFYAGVHELLLGGADPNYRVRLTTPLHMAAKQGDALMACYLLAHGAHPRPFDMHNRTPLDYTSKGSLVYAVLEDAQNQVPSLQALTRMAFRAVLRRLNKEDLVSLRLPQCLCDYMAFSLL